MNEENENKSLNVAQEQIKKQRTIGQLAKLIDKTDKEIARLEAQLNKKYEFIEELKNEFKNLL